jgi:hypothetical protein
MADDARRAAAVRSRLARVLGIHTQERAWRQGARGEKLVADQLRRLPKAWRVFHDISIDGAGHNVDHLVVGPGGVFSLNTKNLSGSVWVAERAVRVNYKPTDYLSKANWEGKQVSRRLSAAAGVPVRARPVIVVIADRLTVKAQPATVTVVGRRRITAWLQTQPSRLDETEIRFLVECVVDLSTWR